jgi:hypothetical protein
VHEGGRGDQGVPEGRGIGYVQRRGPARDRLVDGEQAARESGGNAAIEPSAQNPTLRGIATLSEEHSVLELIQ